MAQPEIHFVISAPRSGSTWLTKALNQHAEIFATEHRLFGDFCEVWQNNDGTSAPRITFDKYAEAFAVHYSFEEMGMNRRQFRDALERSFANFIVSFAQRRTSKPIVVDKVTPYPGTAHHVVARVRELFPDSKIIQLIRDGRDVLTSGTYDWLLKDAVGTPRHDFFVENKPMVLDRFFDDSVLEKWALNWKETIDAFVSPADAQIRYELMKTDLPGQCKTVFETVGAVDSAANNLAAANAVGATDFKLQTGRTEGDSANPTAKARKGVAGDWKSHFTKQDGRQFLELTGDLLYELGYEADRGWIDELPERLDLRTTPK